MDQPKTNLPADVKLALLDKHLTQGLERITELENELQKLTESYATLKERVQDHLVDDHGKPWELL